ncbi:unnamed protein product [Fraxinus pennsylvanica]|uniref:Uncharacterized protein n=1 Tax=Fraxinus pennsylvanica TaxID=56036 RepID=A0AAD2A183_9LAMI|nr:unnamed protein product [Fraxinus pennsylvanica]
MGFGFSRDGDEAEFDNLDDKKAFIDLGFGSLKKFPEEYWVPALFRVKRSFLPLNPQLPGKDSLVGLAAEAAKKALQMAEVDADDVDLVLMCSSTPEVLRKIEVQEAHFNSPRENLLATFYFALMTLDPLLASADQPLPRFNELLAPTTLYPLYRFGNPLPLKIRALKLKY